MCLAGGSDGTKKKLDQKNREYNLNVPRPGRSSVTGRGLETGDRFACAVADPFSPSYNARVIALLKSVGDAASQATLVAAAKALMHRALGDI